MEKECLSLLRAFQSLHTYLAWEIFTMFIFHNSLPLILNVIEPLDTHYADFCVHTSLVSIFNTRKKLATCKTTHFSYYEPTLKWKSLLRNSMVSSLTHTKLIALTLFCPNFTRKKIIDLTGWRQKIRYHVSNSISFGNYCPRVAQQFFFWQILERIDMAHDIPS